MGDQQVAILNPSQVEAAAAFMPLLRVQQAIDRFNAVLSFTQTIMRPGKDYGTIAGIDRPTLLKPGAEKLCSFFGLTPRFASIKQIEDWGDAGEALFFYHAKCQLWRGDVLIAEGEGSCNSRETKYRYRWAPEDQVPFGMDKKRLMTRAGRISEFDFAIEKAETTGKYGKPAAYWKAFKDAIANKTAVRIMKRQRDGSSRPAWEIDSTVYRIPNPEIADQANTILRMAQKRALIAATLIACSASEYYTQDVEDVEPIDAPHTEEPHAANPSPPDPEPPPKSEEELDPTLQETLLRFRQDPKAIEPTLEQTKKWFAEVGHAEDFDAVLAQHGLGPGGKRSLANAIKAYKALWQRGKEIMQQQAAEAPVEEPEG